MHSPEVVAWQIRRPWPRVTRPSRKQSTKLHGAFWHVGAFELYWPDLLTIWHIEPNGHDSLTVCGDSRWRWHIHHWRISVRPWQHLRRWALTRCEWCHGRSRRGDRVNFSGSWERTPSRWWRGERDLYHESCHSIRTAHMACLCEDGLYESVLDGWGYGRCALCGKNREWRSKGKRDRRVIDDNRRILASIPAGQRDAAKWAAVCRAWDLARPERRDEVDR